MLHPCDLNVAIEEILRGDPDGFRRIMREYGLSVRAYVATQIYNLEDVDDIAQDVFIEAYRNLASYHRGQDFGGWLRGIAQNKIYNHFRKVSRRNKLLQRFREEVSRVAESRLDRRMSEDADAIETLLHCVSRLPSRMRQIVRAGLDGDKPADLAGRLMMTIGAVYRLHFRANQLLRKCMHEELG